MATYIINIIIVYTNMNVLKFYRKCSQCEFSTTQLVSYIYYIEMRLVISNACIQTLQSGNYGILIYGLYLSSEISVDIFESHDVKEISFSFTKLSS